MPSVLIVDDEPNIAVSLDFLMRQEGYAVRTVHSGEAALAALADEPAAACYDDPEARAAALRRARVTYLRWGAHGKVAQLDEKLAGLPSVMPEPL